MKIKERNKNVNGIHTIIIKMTYLIIFGVEEFQKKSCGQLFIQNLCIE